MSRAKTNVPEWMSHRKFKVFLSPDPGRQDNNRIQANDFVYEIYTKYYNTLNKNLKA